MKRELSSYRDPDGYVAYIGDDVYRCILEKDVPILSSAYENFFKEAVRRGLLVPYEPVSDLSVLSTEKSTNGSALKLEKLPFVTYPYEWSFTQLKEAAQITLDLCLLALDHGLSLKDATAFNVQQYKGHMIFIDHTSFEKSDKKLPWRAYSQFCRHFIVPLLIASRRGHNANKLFRLALDGPEIEEACIALPWTDRFKPSVFMHIYLHNRLIKNFRDKNDKPVKRKRSGDQKAYILHLKHFIEKIKPPAYDTEWHDYYNNTNYADEPFREKERIIDEITAGEKRGCIWDIGANNGHFSRVAAKHSAIVVSMDIDHAAVDLNFVKNRAEKIKNVYPIVIDLINPSPALGFGNAERKTLGERGQPDIIIALALVHHLAVTYNVPFSMIARQLHSYNADLVIEYVDREDSQFQKLLRSKDDTYDLYNKKNFERCFFALFDLVKTYDIKDTHRIIYHLRPKKEK